MADGFGSLASAAPAGRTTSNARIFKPIRPPDFHYDPRAGLVLPLARGACARRAGAQVSVVARGDAGYRAARLPADAARELRGCSPRATHPGRRGVPRSAPERSAGRSRRPILEL